MQIYHTNRSDVVVVKIRISGYTYIFNNPANHYLKLKQTNLRDTRIN